jgi:hypothetical protein
MAVCWGPGGIRGESIEPVADRGLDMPDLVPLVGEECGERGVAADGFPAPFAAEEDEDLLEKS